MPKDIVPGTTGQTDELQITEMEKYPDYKTANANPLAIAIAMNYLISGDRIYEKYGRCEEIPSVGVRAVVGYFPADGLLVSDSADTDGVDWLGRAVFWNLQK